MMRSLYSGVSGLKTHQTKMDVIGNNIANVNTVAFKSASTTFSDIMYQTTQSASGATGTTGGTNPKQIGLGVTNGATKVSITAAGAAQSTGQAFDIRLTDSNSTNFFIVNNGSENLFTRAGSFYIDGNGNLAMTTTGYLLMGWQVDPATGNVRQDTVSALRVMQASNLTSPPEYTTKATFSGVIDENDTNVGSEGGYIRNLYFYDNLGYAYTAKFAIKNKEGEDGAYTVELTSIIDDDGKDILADYVKAAEAMKADQNNYDAAGNYNEGLPKGIEDIFGAATTGTYSYKISSKNFYSDPDQPKITIYEEAGKTYKSDGQVRATEVDVNGTKQPSYYITFANVNDPADTKNVSLAEIYGLSDEAALNNTDADAGSTTTVTDGLTINNEGKLVRKYNTTNYDIKFDTSDGKLQYVMSSGNTSAMLNLDLKTDPNLGDAFSNIQIDFSQLLNYDNGGSSTVEANRGAADGTTGAGKKLGTLTGVSIDQTGKIFGTYNNGNTSLLGQVAVAQFSNASGLESLGNNCYGTTLNSGEFDGIGVDVSADGGKMNTGQLEMSNVDLSAEFTDMIVTQRGFQANSRIITVSDTLLEELINLKR